MSGFALRCLTTSRRPQTWRWTCAQFMSPPSSPVSLSAPAATPILCTATSLRLPTARSYSSQVEDVSYSQLLHILEDKSAVVVDVRNPQELLDYGAIPGAINIPLGDLEVRCSCEMFMKSY